jgi:hypothetical protein
LCLKYSRLQQQQQAQARTATFSRKAGAT